MSDVIESLPGPATGNIHGGQQHAVDEPMEVGRLSPLNEKVQMLQWHRIPDGNSMDLGPFPDP